MNLFRTISSHLLIVCAVFMLHGCGSAEQRKAVHMERGQTFFQDGIYEKARIEFKNVLQINPKDAEGRFWLAQSLEKLQRWRNAAGNYLAVVQLDKSHIGARVRLGQIYLAANVIDDALTQAQEALDIDPRNSDALVLRGTARFRQDELNGAMDDARTVLQQVPGHVNGIALLAALHMKGERSGEALSVVDDGIVRNPGNVKLLVIKAAIHTARKETGDAARQLEEVVRQEPGTLGHRLRLAGFYVGQRQLDRAEEVLRAAVAHDNEDATAKLALVSFLAKYANRRRAEEALLVFLQQDQSDQQLRFALAGLYGISKETTKAQRVYQEIIAQEGLAPDGLKARTKLAKFLVQEGEGEKARILVEEVLEENPQDSEGLLVRAGIALRKDEPTSAIADLRAVLRNQPNSSQVLRLLANAQLLNDQDALARDNLEKALKNNPDDLLVRAELIKLLTKLGETKGAQRLLPQDSDRIQGLFRLYSRRGDWGAALRTAKQMKTVFPDDPAGYYLSGIALQGEQQFEQSVDQFGQALEKAPNAAEPLAQMVKSYFALGEIEEALVRLNKTLKREPNNLVARELAGEIFLRQGKLDDAEDAFRKVLQLKPKWNVPYIRLAAALLAKGDLSGATEAYERGLSQTPGDMALLTGLAQRYEQQGEYDKAVTTYEEILKIQPGSTIAINNLAMILAEYKTDAASLERAAKLAERLDGARNPLFLDTIGWIDYKKGEVDTAIETLQRAVKAAPTVPVLEYHLGMAYLGKGDKEQARTHLEVALHHGDDKFVEREQARKALESL